MKTSLTLSLAFAMLTLAVPASAATVRWNLLNVAFDDGGTASGYFLVDTNTNVTLLPDYDIFVTAGSTLGALHYQYSTQFAQAGHTAAQFNFYGPAGSQRYLVLQTTALLTSSTGTVPLNIPGVNSECHNCSPVRFAVSGSVTTDDVAAPEPGTLGLLLLGGSALFARRISTNKSRRQ